MKKSLKRICRKPREEILHLTQLAGRVVGGEVAVHRLAEVLRLGPAHRGGGVQEGSVRLLQERKFKIAMTSCDSGMSRSCSDAC